MKISRFTHLMVLVGILPLASCSDAPVFGAGAGETQQTATAQAALQSTVTTVEIRPTSATLRPGSTLQLWATGRDANGALVRDVRATWSTSDERIARVATNGLVKAVKNGTATITAVIGDAQATASILVSDGSTPVVPVASVQVMPSSASVAAGQSIQFIATTQDASGNQLSGRAIAWSSSNPSIATVNASGLVSGAGAGSATITATSEGVQGSGSVTVTATTTPVASVQVTPAAPSISTAQTVQLTATARDASGNALSGRTATWASANTGVARVSSSGLVTPIAQGTANIVATVDGVSGGATVTVTSGVDAVTITPATASMTALGATAQLRAVASLNGAPVQSSVAWTSLNPAVATVDTMGRVRAISVGSALIVATAVCCSSADTAHVTVTQVPASIALSPTQANVAYGQQIQVTATVRDANSNTIPSVQVAWSATAGATVSTTGLVTAGSTATDVTVTAAAGNARGTMAVHVFDPAPPPPPPSGGTSGFGPRDFPSTAVITGEDWRDFASTTEAFNITGFFYRLGGAPVLPLLQLENDAIFGRVIRAEHNPPDATSPDANTNVVRAGRAFNHPRARGGTAQYGVEQYIYSTVIRLSSNWGGANWKWMFGRFPNGPTQRIEIASSSPGAQGFFIYTGQGSDWTHIRTVHSDHPVFFPPPLTDWWQGVMFIKRISATEVRFGQARRRLTTGGGSVWSPGPWEGIVDAYNPNGIDFNDRIVGIDFGNTRNPGLPNQQYVWYGPWVVLDLAGANAPGDPWGVFSALGT